MIAPESQSETVSAEPSREERDFVKYTFYRLDPSWRRNAPGSRREGRRELATLLENSSDLLVQTYSLVGLKAGTDSLIWTVSESLDAIQQFHARVAGTRLGSYMDVTYSYLGMGRKSEYLGAHAHEGQEGAAGHRRPKGRPYLIVYPFVKKREWYGLPFEERRRIMADHFRIGHAFPNVDIHTGYSFGIDDAEFILAFESDTPGEFLDLVEKLRGSEASRYTALETPIFTCRLVEPDRMLELADGVV